MRLTGQAENCIRVALEGALAFARGLRKFTRRGRERREAKAAGGAGKIARDLLHRG